MTETYYTGTYWPARRESAEACARRAETFFRLLSRCDPIYTRWFEQAYSLEKALQLQFEPTFETFMRFFGRKMYQQGKGGNGFSIGAWTGHEDEGHGSSLSLLCGADSRFYSNVCVLHPPSDNPEAERVLSATVQAEVMRAMVLAWEPDWGGVFSYCLRGAETRAQGGPQNGLADVSLSPAR
jgi:hypothetical protein